MTVTCGFPKNSSSNKKVVDWSAMFIEEWCDQNDVQCHGLLHWIDLQCCRLQHCKLIGSIRDILICNVVDWHCGKSQLIVAAAIAHWHSPSKRLHTKTVMTKGQWCAPEKDHSRANNVAQPQEVTKKPQYLVAAKKAMTMKDQCHATQKGLQQCKQCPKGSKETPMSRSPKRPRWQITNVLWPQKNRNDKGLMLHTPKKDHGNTKQCCMAPKAVPMKHQHCTAFFCNDEAGMPRAPKSAAAMQNNVMQP